jgi:hypothetical protein
MHSPDHMTSARPNAAVWMASAFCAELGLAALVLAAWGTGERGTNIALQVTARFSFLLFWPAYVAGATTALFGSVFEPLKKRVREFGLSFASAHLVHLALVAWLIYIGRAPPCEVFIFSESPSCGPAFSCCSRSLVCNTRWAQVVPTRGRAQLHSLCFCGRFFEISATWQHQVLSGIRAFRRSFRRRAIVMPCRVYATPRDGKFALKYLPADGSPRAQTEGKVRPVRIGLSCAERPSPAAGSGILDAKTRVQKSLLSAETTQSSDVERAWPNDDSTRRIHKLIARVSAARSMKKT